MSTTAAATAAAAAQSERSHPVVVLVLLRMEHLQPVLIHQSSANGLVYMQRHTRAHAHIAT